MVVQVSNQLLYQVWLLLDRGWVPWDLVCGLWLSSHKTHCSELVQLRDPFGLVWGSGLGCGQCSPRGRSYIVGLGLQGKCWVLFPPTPNLHLQQMLLIGRCCGMMAEFASHQCILGSIPVPSSAVLNNFHFLCGVGIAEFHSMYDADTNKKVRTIPEFFKILF